MRMRHSIEGMEIITALSPMIISFAVIASIGLMVMIFSVVFAQLMYGLFE